MEHSAPSLAPIFFANRRLIKDVDIDDHKISNESESPDNRDNKLYTRFLYSSAFAPILRSCNGGLHNSNGWDRME